MKFNDDTPIYLQISDMIENDILSGNLAPEDQAPSTNEFSRVYQINPATARKGLNILIDQGILYKKRGMGMFVTEGARDIIIKKRQVEFFELLLPELLSEAKRLEIDVGELIKMIEKSAGEDK